jgi:hypothetical protein
MHVVESPSAFLDQPKLLLMAWFTGACLANVATAKALNVTETDSAIVVRRDAQTVVSYNKVSPPAPSGIDSVCERSGCLHPVNSPRGHTVTQMFPVDHPHQHGVFSAWVNTTYNGQSVDFWNLAGGTGRVLHERVVGTFQEPDAAGFEVDLIHRSTKTAVDVLRERWKISVYPTDDTYHCFDLETTQTALTDKPLIVNEYHYGGMALRGPTRWLTPKDREARENPDLIREPSDFMNDLGSDRVNGNHQHVKWVALTGSIDSEPVTIAVLSHADNFRAPQAARLHPTKPYFCFAPCFDGNFAIDRKHPFKARYRYLVTDARPDAKWIDQQWDAWCGK